MKYFFINVHPLFATAPNLINWYFKFEKRWIHPDTSYKLPDRIVMEISSTMDIVFTDVVSDPYFLLSEKGKEVLELYQPKTIFKELVLMDTKGRVAQVYYLPILPVLYCLHESSVLTPDNVVVKKAVLDTAKIGEEKLFRLGEAKNTYCVAHLDFVESLLRRGARGVGLTPLAMHPQKEFYHTGGRL